MPLSDEAKDKFIAPEMSKFTTASIRDMAAVSTQQDYWLTNFVLNTLLRVTVEEQVRQTLFNFLRRARLAFREYLLAREQTMSYLRNTDEVGAYIAAIGHWEVFLFQAYEAYWLIARTERILFRPRVSAPAVEFPVQPVKTHCAGYPGGQLPEDGTMAVWLTNDGLRSTQSWLTFDEMAEILDDLARWSDAVQDPLTMRENILRHIAGGNGAPA